MHNSNVKRCLWGTASIATALAVSCATSPTGRRQLMLVEDSAMSKLGDQGFAEIQKQTKESTDEGVKAYVNCVASSIVKHLDDEYQLPEGKRWTVKVFDDPAANAFALPGGNIGVFTGLLKVAKNEHQLATVVAHEVGHVIADHGGERISHALVAQGGLAAADMLMQDRQSKSLVLAALGAGAQVGVLLPYGRKQESESDIIGLRLMAKSGFDPRQSVQLWKNMAEANPGGPPQFLSTHPSPENRIEKLQAAMAGAVKLQQQAVAAQTRPSCRAVAWQAFPNGGDEVATTFLK